ncbi:hypothetical protein B0H10DRAFT_2067044 [Mycena sp. CBHHK59/15]|nr:hypothetical protein B0H10DRAFT_2067044 [Mycena sp. CBHHK59/15]
MPIFQLSACSELSCLFFFCPLLRPTCLCFCCNSNSNSKNVHLYTNQESQLQSECAATTCPTLLACCCILSPRGMQ